MNNDNNNLSTCNNNTNLNTDPSTFKKLKKRSILDEYLSLNAHKEGETIVTTDYKFEFEVYDALCIIEDSLEIFDNNNKKVKNQKLECISKFVMYKAYLKSNSLDLFFKPMSIKLLQFMSMIQISQEYYLISNIDLFFRLCQKHLSIDKLNLIEFTKKFEIKNEYIDILSNLLFICLELIKQRAIDDQGKHVITENFIQTEIYTYPTQTGIIMEENKQLTNQQTILYYSNELSKSEIDHNINWNDNKTMDLLPSYHTQGRSMGKKRIYQNLENFIVEEENEKISGKHTNKISAINELIENENSGLLAIREAAVKVCNSELEKDVPVSLTDNDSNLTSSEGNTTNSSNSHTFRRKKSLSRISSTSSLENSFSLVSLPKSPQRTSPINDSSELHSTDNRVKIDSSFIVQWISSLKGISLTPGKTLRVQMTKSPKSTSKWTKNVENFIDACWLYEFGLLLCDRPVSLSQLLKYGNYLSLVKFGIVENEIDYYNQLGCWTAKFDRMLIVDNTSKAVEVYNNIIPNVESINENYNLSSLGKSCLELPPPKIYTTGIAKEIKK
jgi:hypothetical protein